MGSGEMILLSTIIKKFKGSYKTKYSPLPSHLTAINAMKNCRTSASPHLFAQCKDCDNHTFIPHSCGHRSCPHCQAHESQQWIENQLKRQVPANYFMVTFTLPKELRTIAWANQKVFYNLMFECSKDTLQVFTKNDNDLGGKAGLMSVLHTHARNLDYHPHIHIIIAAASVNQKTKTYNTKQGKYLFNHKALAKVFRGKLLSKMTHLNMKIKHITSQWIVDCKYVGKGDKAIVYLGRYLYRGVIREKDIISCKEGKVTYRYINSKTKKYQYKTVTGEYFLYLIMQHILPKGFRRSRNYGFVHPNCKRMIALIHYLLKFKPLKFIAKSRPPILCKCCGAVMEIIRTQIKRALMFDLVPI
jgi:hypothetical protein